MSEMTLTEQACFATFLQGMAAQEGERALVQEREMTSETLDKRCRSTIRRSFYRVKRSWMRGLIAAVVVVVLLTAVVAASPVLRRIVGNYVFTRSEIGTDITMDDAEVVEKNGDDFSVLDHYEITFGYLPELPLMQEMEEDYAYFYSFAGEKQRMVIEFANMDGYNISLNSEDAVITSPVIQQHSAELYDHGDAAILVMPWDDMTLLVVDYEGSDDAAEIVQRVAEEMRVTEK